MSYPREERKKRKRREREERRETVICRTEAQSH